MSVKIVNTEAHSSDGERSNSNEDLVSENGGKKRCPDDMSKQQSIEEHKEEPIFTVLTRGERRLLVSFLGLCSIWSPISNSVYFPALSELSRDFKVSSSTMNVSLVSYLVLQGTAPTVLAFFSDNYGRRPAVLWCLIAYSGVCVALNQINVFWGLVVLRCLQAAAVAPLVPIAFGMLGDICIPEERGRYVGLVSGIQLVGQGMGSLIGSGIIERFGWRGVFAFLAIGGGSTFAIAIFALPETNRRFVGNFTVAPRRFLNKSPIILLPHFRKRLTEDQGTLATRNPSVKNLIAPFKILSNANVFFLILPSGLQYAIWTMMLTTLATSLESNYDYTIIQVGLCYIAPGVGTFMGSILIGRFIDWNYRRKLASYNAQFADVPADTRPNFDGVAARLQFFNVSTILNIGFTALFGWGLEKHISVAPVLVASFMMSLSAMALMSAISTVLVDLYPEKGSASTSCMNFVRCLLAAAGSGALQSMIETIGEGGCFTVMIGLLILSSIVFIVILELRKKKARR
ncbi:Piso0_004934 [Millerozyma farinosa CBS 7064]|uniref:Piso0_004934 protein n=1 Tax=Pichia sorbitophila (strain ATCC MYA-4447 / BCRC 22081 / CBS 7064 / NBRC 10061 / NRRL Y-12695) TaxID=559304 RepID=G8Y0U1_PICSO|nr:Piso0_004934 [Millerozyma farinosa CBS 7064]